MKEEGIKEKKGEKLNAHKPKLIKGGSSFHHLAEEPQVIKELNRDEIIEKLSKESSESAQTPQGNLMQSKAR